MEGGLGALLALAARVPVAQRKNGSAAAFGASPAIPVTGF